MPSDLPKVTEFSQFRELLNKASKHAREVVPFGGDIPYGSKNRQTVDIFGTDTLPPDSGIVLFIHGGKWQFLDKEHSCHLVLPLIKANVRPIITDFNMAPTVTLEEMIEEVRTATKFVFDYALKYNVRSVVVCGHSSGAHLTACLLEPSWMKTLSVEALNIFTGVVLISGVYDITTILSSDNNKVMKLDKERAEKCSPMLFEKLESEVSINLKVLIAVGGGETDYFIQQSKDFYEVLKEQKGLAVEHCSLDNLNHFQTNLYLKDSDYKMTSKLIDMVKSKS